jgi:hypothetical protein
MRRRRNQLVANADFACAGLDEPGDQAQRRCFAAAGWAQQTNQVTVFDRERYVVDNRDSAISLGQVSQLDRRHALLP